MNIKEKQATIYYLSREDSIRYFSLLHSLDLVVHDQVTQSYFINNKHNNIVLYFYPFGHLRVVQLCTLGWMEERAYTKLCDFKIFFKLLLKVIN